jgi:hypothetical protein
MEGYSMKKRLVRVWIPDREGWNVPGDDPGCLLGKIPAAEWVVQQNVQNFMARDWMLMVVDAFLKSAGYIQVGTGWTEGRKLNAQCNRPAGGIQRLDGGYPNWAVPGSGREGTTVVYRATFPAGSLHARGINEVCLLDRNDTSDCLAYAHISPAVNISFGDTLQILWEIAIRTTGESGEGE